MSLKRLVSLLVLLLLCGEASAVLKVGDCSISMPTTNTTVDCTDADAGFSSDVKAIVVLSSANPTTDSGAIQAHNIVGFAANNSGTTQSVVDMFGNDNSSPSGEATQNSSTKVWIKYSSAQIADLSSWLPTGARINQTTNDSSGVSYKLQGLLLGGDIEAKVLKFDWSAQSGNKAVAHGLGGAPEILIAISPDRAADTAGAQARLLAGFWAAATHRGLYWRVVDNVSTTQANMESSTSGWPLQAAASLLTVGTVDGTNVNISSSGTITSTLYVLALRATSGAPLSAAVGTYDGPTSTSSTSVTGLAFPPQAVMVLGSGQTAVGSTTDDTASRYSLGYAITNSGGISQGAHGFNADDALAQPSDRNQTSSNSRLVNIMAVNGTNTTNRCSLTSFNADGFTCSWTIGTATAYKNYYLAFAQVDQTAPTCSVAPATTAQTATSITIDATCSDAVDSSVTHYIAVVADGASAPSAAQIVAGTGGGIIASSGASGSAANGANKSLVSGSVLTQGTPYDGYHTVCDSSSNCKTPVKVDATTTSTDVTSTVIQQCAFTASNGTAIASYTCETDTAGNAWVASKLHTSATLGANEIQSNKLNIAAVNNAAIVDTETTDKMFVVNWTPTAASINDAAIVVRYVDASNFIACGFTARATVNNSYILRTVAGSGSYNPIVSKSYTLGNTYQIFGGNIGDTIVCGVDGVIGATTSMSDFSSNTKGGYGSIGSNTLQVFDLGYTHTTYPGLLPSGRLPDDPDGMLNGMNIGAGSGFWMAPGDVPTTICSASSFYAGGSIYCNPVAGTHDVDFVLYNSTPNAISTVNVQVTKSGAGAVAPVLGAIPAEVCTINVDCGARSLVQYETTAAEPAGTWTDDGNGAPGRLLSPSGTITGACATPGVFTREVTDTNATGSDDATISETCSADQIPDALSGPLDVVGADVDTLYTVGTTASTGSCWSITGISFTTSFTFSRSDTAEYQKNGGAWVSTGSGTVENNDVICPRETSASGDNEARSATLNVNGVADTWTIVTAPDTNADDLTFPSVQSATAASTAQSVCQTVSGLGDGVSIAASVDIGTWTKTCAGGTGYGAGAGTITNGDSIGLRQTFPAAGIAQTQQFAYGDKTASFVAETLLGTPPVCSLDIETQFKVVGDALNLDIGVGCTGVDSWSYSEAELPNGASGSGSVISATSLTGNAGAREDVTTIAQAINQFGTLNRAVVFHIAPAGIVSECSQRKYGSVGHTITSSVTKCPLSP